MPQAIPVLTAKLFRKLWTDTIKLTVALGTIVEHFNVIVFIRTGHTGHV